jgi:erythromycin esterase
MNIRILNSLILALILVQLLNTGCRKTPEEKTDPDIDWLRNELVAISSADPAVNEPSFDAILAKIGDPQIVALGEGSHGTREFWQLRQKLTRYLVEKKGFSAILMETGFPSSFALHDYITAGVGDEADVHERLGTWRYVEMQEFIRWMRQYNIEHPAGAGGPALHFYGYDTAFIDWTEAIRLIIEYLQEVDPGMVDDINTRLLNHTMEDAVFVRDFFEANEALYVSLSSTEEYNIIFRFANNLIASLEIWDRFRQDKPTLEYRDSVNIQNVNCIMENLLPGHKIILWAHNGHICTGYWWDTGGKVRILGSRLRDQFGSLYYPIATEFYGGHFRAWDVCEGHDYLFISQTAAAPPGDSYTYMFKQAGIPFFYLDIRHIDFSDSDALWVMGPYRIRSIGATYCFNHDLLFYDTISLPEYYDGLMFVENSTPITPITF